MPATFAKKTDLQRQQPAVGRLVGVDVKEMDCIGTCEVELQLGEVKHTVEIAVVKQLNGPPLSWHDCISLGILPRTYTQQIRTIKHHSAAA